MLLVQTVTWSVVGQLKRRVLRTIRSLYGGAPSFGWSFVVIRVDWCSVGAWRSVDQAGFRRGGVSSGSNWLPSATSAS